MTLVVAYDGSYKDDQGKPQYLFNVVLRAIRSMTECQKVMIVEGKSEEESEERNEGGVREDSLGKCKEETRRIWPVHFSISGYVADTIK